jgi:RimJ/RimL family protein N-acetyltransferase
MPASRFNEYGQEIGFALPEWTPPPLPPHEVMTGRLCTLVPLHIEHADPLFDAFGLDVDDRGWTYLPYGPFPSRDDFRAWVAENAVSDDLILFTIMSGDERVPTGIAGYLRIMPGSGSIEVGHLRYSKLLQRTPAATEAMFLMMALAFRLGYRRYEWKCDVFNAPSRRAAERLGFTFDGIFRQATVYKGRTRDTAWFSVIDTEWPVVAKAFELWLSPENFDASGQQIRRLEDIRADVGNKSVAPRV